MIDRPGTQLANLIAEIGLQSAGCNRCKLLAGHMDAMTPDEVRGSIDTLAERIAQNVSSNRTKGVTWLEAKGIRALIGIAADRAEGIPDSLATKATLAAAKRLT